MEFKKSKYPLIAVAYRISAGIDNIKAREIIHNEREEQNFRARYGTKNTIRLEEPNVSDMKNLSRWQIIIKQIPAWGYIILTIAYTALVAFITKVLSSCQ